MKKALKILNILYILLFCAAVILIFVNAAVRNANIPLVIGIITLIAFFVALVHFIFSLVFKIKIGLFSLYLFLFLAGASFYIVFLMTGIKILEYISYAILFPNWLLGFYLENEDDIKKRMEEKLEEKNKK